MILSDGTSLNSAEKEESGKNAILVTNWSTIVLNKTANGNTCIIGQGAFGIVVRGLWMHNGRGTDVAIKVVTRSLALASRCKYSDEYDRIRNEAELIYRAQKLMLFRENIIQVYGLVSGVLPEALTSAFGISKGEDALGMIMRFEEGGSLDKLLYPPPGIIQTPLKMVEKLNILLDIANALYELHSIKIIHGDIKSQNVLLGAGRVARLADFGLSAIRSAVTDSSIGSSILSETSTASIGTPVYCAPEMLVCGDDNELDGEDSQHLHARSSRSTDMYSFGILTWEVLCSEKPWATLRSEIVLARRVCGGDRPSLDLLPRDTPPTVRAMMEACWSGDRTKRLSASQCHSILQHAVYILQNDHYDIFLSHAWANKVILSQVYLMLSRLGYRIWYDQDEMGYDLRRSMKEGIKSSCVTIVCLNQTYQSRENCMYEFNEAMKHAKDDGSTHVIPIFLEANHHKWMSKEVRSEIDMNNCEGVDFSGYGSDWNDTDGVSDVVMTYLGAQVATLHSLLHSKGCIPSLVAKSSTEHYEAKALVDLETLPWLIGKKIREAARAGDSEKLEQIVNNPTALSYLDEGDDDGRPALYLAAQKGYNDVVKTLINLNASVDKQCNDGKTALFGAIASGCTETARILIEEGSAKVNLARVNGATPLYCACDKGLIDCVNLLIKSHANVDTADVIDGTTPLMKSVEKGNFECIKALLIAGADIHKTNKMNSKAEAFTKNGRILALLHRYEFIRSGGTLTWEASLWIWKDVCLDPERYGYSSLELYMRSVAACLFPFMSMLMIATYSVQDYRAPTIALQMCCTSVCCMGCFVHAPLRRNIRKMSDISEAYYCEDYVITTFCSPCAIFQEHHQLRLLVPDFDDITEASKNSV